MSKKPHDIPKMFSLIRKAIQPFPKAMLFELSEEGRQSPFEQLVACVLSIRTRDETSLHVARRLLSVASTPARMAALSLEELADIVRPCTFPFQKAQTLLKMSQKILSDHHGQTPCDFDSLTSLPGVGPKCANLVLGIACGKPAIGVDIHVHRITNRWGYASSPSPEGTLRQLKEKLPPSKWVEINELLVPFGKHICTGAAPKCPICPVLDYCQQIGVKTVKKRSTSRPAIVQLGRH